MRKYLGSIKFQKRFHIISAEFAQLDSVHERNILVVNIVHNLPQTAENKRLDLVVVFVWTRQDAIKSLL